MPPRGFRLHVSGWSPIDNFSSMSAPDSWLKQFVPVPRTYCNQIMGIVGPVSGSRNIRDGTFYDDVLLHFDAVGTENVSFPKPVSSASCHVDRSHCLGNLRFAIHPLAQFLSSVLKNNSDLIFITVLVRHLFLPSATTVLGSTEGAPQLCGPRSTPARTAENGGPAHSGTGPALQGPIPSNTLAIGLT